MSRFPKPTGWLPLVAGALSCALAVALTTNPRLEDRLNTLMPSPMAPDIVVVAIDDASLNDYGRLSNWPRELYAEAINTLEEAGAKAIGLDVILTDPSPEDPKLADAFSAPNLVLALAPNSEAQYHRSWKSPSAISALNVGIDNRIRTFQTAYATNATEPEPSTLAPTLAFRLAELGGIQATASTQNRLLRVSPQPATVSFRDVVNGTVRFGELQDKIVLIGVTATTVENATVRDAAGERTPGVFLQARAINSLRYPTIWQPTLPVTVLMALAAVLAALALGTPANFALTFFLPLLALPLWKMGISFPGVTVSFAALLGTLATLLGQAWKVRRSGMEDTQTGLGNRLAFTRAVEHRWQHREQRPIGLVLVDLSSIRRVTEIYGFVAGNEFLQEISERIGQQELGSDILFRWSTDEFAVLIDQATPQKVSETAQKWRTLLGGLRFRDVIVDVSIGSSMTTPEIETPNMLIEAASRDRYRMKYQQGAQD